LDWGVAEWADDDGKKHTNYHWFNGKIGDYGGHHYGAVPQLARGGSSLLVPADNGDLVRIRNSGIVRAVEGRWTPAPVAMEGQGNINAAAGAFDAALPFGRHIREALLGPGGVETNSPEYENAAIISAGVVIGATLLDGAGEAKAATALAEEAAPNRINSARVLLRSAEETGPYHNFPESFNEQIFQGSRTVTRNFFKVDRQSLSNDSILYRAPGSINGKAGTFEIGVRPSVSGRTEVIMHRFFRPGP